MQMSRTEMHADEYEPIIKLIRVYQEPHLGEKSTREEEIGLINMTGERQEIWLQYIFIANIFNIFYFFFFLRKTKIFNI